MLARGEKEINQLLLKFVCCRFAFGFSGPPCFVMFVMSVFVVSCFLVFCSSCFFCLFWFSCSLVFLFLVHDVFVLVFVVVVVAVAIFSSSGKNPCWGKIHLYNLELSQQHLFQLRRLGQGATGHESFKEGNPKKKVKEQLKGETWKWMDTMVASW